MRLILILLAASAGCSASTLGLSSGQLKPYNAQTLDMQGRQATLYRAMLEFTIDNNLRLTYEDANLGRIEAVGEVEKGGGMITRERWTFQIEGSALSIESRLEQKRFSRGWGSPNGVNSRYTYTREKMALQDIKGRLANVESHTVAER